MTPLLFLSHRIPYPPNKGDKVRSFHLLKSLSRHFDIYLGAFVDDPEDWKYRDGINDFCKLNYLRPLNPLQAKIRSLKGFLTGEALSLPYYRDMHMVRWVKNIIKQENIEHAIIYSSSMAQYIDAKLNNLRVRVADFVDIDSDKWLQYSKRHGFPMSIVYQREADRLLEFEREIARKFNATLFVSESEKNDFDKIAPDSKYQHYFYNNGVDYDYFNPANKLLNPYNTDSVNIAFTGAMDYWANVDAVKWFTIYILPKILKAIPNARFYIVGSNPSVTVTELEKSNNVVVTGRVDDIRPYIKFADLIVAPMRIARGIQNKVLEAMAMSRPIVATSLALEGIQKCGNYHPYQADTEDLFAKRCLDVLNGEMTSIPESRECIREHYDWDKNIQVVTRLLSDA